MTQSSDSEQKTNGHIAYALYAAGFVIPFASIAGLIFCYIKREAHDGALWAGHMTWLIRTFWIGLIASVVSFVLMFVLIGYLTFLATIIWFIYRIVKGWIYWNDGRTIAGAQAIL